MAGEQAVPSIAVLPFADMSPQRDQEYFCEGVAEEIINALTGTAAADTQLVRCSCGVGGGRRTVQTRPCAPAPGRLTPNGDTIAER